MNTTFDEFFSKATTLRGEKPRTPYDYQRRLACGASEGRSEAEWLSSGTPCRSQLIDIPTGLGKTAAVVLAWLWNRVHLKREDWPRRLVICLPMRTLVEQTRAEAASWLEVHGLRWNGKSSPVEQVGLHLLMGGEDAGEWDIHPEADAILIGTQDMLLSRALNRGYGSPRARWPMHFGLLNNDALWVLDETQLMGVGVRTSAQLHGLRQKIGVALGCATWWASATLDSRLLVTPDHRTLPDPLRLASDDLKNTEVIRRIQAVKRLTAAPFKLPSDAAKSVGPYVDQLAALVLSHHRSGTTTIVILNRVDRARDLHAAFDRLANKQAIPPRVLLHSRFRPLERDPLSKRIKDLDEKIIIATQAIEAGVDISARTLVTELAPWSSLVQRFGRCNRKGEFNDSGGADVHWINLETEDPKNASGLALPYTPEQLAAARELLRRAEATGVASSALEKLHTDEPLPESHVLRRKDLVDLFDTTPDLAGLDIDVGRYIRDGEERDVQVFWRELPADQKSPDDAIVAQRSELVRVPLYGQSGFQKFYERNKTGGIWLWNVLDGEWQPLRADRLAPGQVYLIDVRLGGYSAALGWTGERGKEPFPVLTVEQQGVPEARDGQGRDDESLSRPSSAQWQSIEAHTNHVVAATESLLKSLPAAGAWANALLTAARWHDVGKAHACFQSFITHGRTIPDELKSAFVAKAPWHPGAKHARPHFRHELASALAWLEAGESGDPHFQNLVAYLIATHHGKIRLSIRAMPGERVPESSSDGANGDSPLYARGIWDGDRLPSDPTKTLAIASVPASPHAFPINLDLSCMQLGEQSSRPSWTARALTLRDAQALGLFRLAWLETLLRAADAAGSKR